MKRLLYTLLLCCAASAQVACTSDPTQDVMPATDEGYTWITLDFGDKSFDEIDITTRATQSGVAEGRISNIFVLLFDSSGKRVYGRYFDNSNRVDSYVDLTAQKEDSWVVLNNADGSAKTRGKARIYAPAIAEGGELHILANINADMVNISPEKLRFVETIDDLRKMTATLNQLITERNGFFPMTGYAKNIKVTTSKIYSNGNDSFVVPLWRIDAKVNVVVRVAEGFSDSYTNADGIITTHKIKAFVPLSWQVVNMPRSTYVIEQDADAKGEMFNSYENKFESRGVQEFTYYNDVEGKDVTTNSDEHGFSFYMLENRPSIKTGMTTGGVYHKRDERLKNADGTYNTTEGMWKYAPEEGTYLVIKGEVVMDLDLSSEAKAQQLSADVVYYVHLGNFAENCDDYSIRRNTAYTYKVTIKGVDKIQLEVESKKQEDESGATGDVYVAKESIFTFDAHYGSGVFAFDEAYITDIDHLSWYVKTPFGREGTPNNINGVEVPSGLDYRWVHFIVNRYTTDENGKEVFSQAHEKYNPEKAMDILAFSKYIKEQKRLFLKDKANGTLDNPSSAFRPELDQAWVDKFPDKPEVHTRYRLRVTIFVDEFYYAANPLTGDTRVDLWKDFVNQPNRVMHILCDSDKSADGASTTTGSVVTIRQRSIQTIYNTEKPELKTAWGCETIDETRDVLWYYSKNENYDSSYNWVKPNEVYPIPGVYSNNSRINGLYNTAKIWDLTPVGKGFQQMDWETFIDFNKPYSLRDDEQYPQYKTLRYACMARNRDDNGNGKIDAAEVKWYIASINQLAALYIGDQGLSPDAVLYPYYKRIVSQEELDKNRHKWRTHIVSSTEGDNHYPIILWAEEGLSTGPYDQQYNKGADLSIRCVRNLGMDPVDEADAQALLNDKSRIPEQAIVVTGPVYGSSEVATPTSVYKFDLTNLNPLSTRYYTSRELEPNVETSVEARTYSVFETGILTDKMYNYDQLYDMLNEGKSPCPEGYRTPNIREASLMSLYSQLEWQEGDGNYSLVSTYNSLGTKGRKLETDGPSWWFNADRVRIEEKGGHMAAKIRCVRDIRQ